MRSSLYRLQIQQDIYGIKRSLTWTHSGLLVPWLVRSVSLAFALRHIGRSPIARLLSLSGRAILIAQIAGLAIRLRRKRPAIVDDQEIVSMHRPDIE